MIVVGALVALAFLISSLTRPIAFVSLCIGVGVAMIGLGIATWDAKCSIQKAIKKWNHKIEFEADKWAANKSRGDVKSAMDYFNNLNEIIQEDSFTHPKLGQRARLLDFQTAEKSRLGNVSVQVS